MGSVPSGTYQQVQKQVIALPHLRLIFSFVVSPGIVVEDCLLLLQNLLKNNNSNQNFFKEGSYIQRMKPWFEVGDDNCGWSAQKVTNLHLMLQVEHCTLLLLPISTGVFSAFQ